MKKLFYGLFTFSIAAAFLFAAPVIQKPLFGEEGAPGKIEQKNKGKEGSSVELPQSPITTQTPTKTMTQQPSQKTQGAVSTGANADATNKAKGGKKKESGKNLDVSR